MEWFNFVDNSIVQHLMTRWCNASSSWIPQSNSHSAPPGHVFLCSDYFPLGNCPINDTVHYFSYCFCRINCSLNEICSMDMIYLHSVILLSTPWLPLALLIPIIFINLSFYKYLSLTKYIESIYYLSVEIKIKNQKLCLLFLMNLNIN